MQVKCRSAKHSIDALRAKVDVLFNLNHTVMKTLRCKDVGFDCDKEIHAETEEAVLEQAAEHALHVHNVKVTPDMVDQIRGLIQEEASAQARGS